MADNLGVNSRVYNNEDFPTEAKVLVSGYVARNTDEAQVEVFIVWFAKSLQNWKALVSTSIPDGRYYEVTHDGNRGVTYLDVYQKFDHLEVVDTPLEEP